MTNEVNDGGPAFPCEMVDQELRDALIAHHKDQLSRTDIYEMTQKRPMAGMTLRDWFAGQALAGMAAGDYWDENFQINDFTSDQMKLLNEAAKVAYLAADAMLAAREGKV